MSLSFSNCRYPETLPPKTEKRRVRGCVKKIGHRVGVRRITHPDAATTNNVRTGPSPARLANFISLSGQALNFGASIIVCALRALQPAVFLFYVASSHPPPRVHTSRDDRNAPSLRFSLRQFDGFHFGSHAIVSLLPVPLRGDALDGEILHGKKENAPRLISTAIKVNSASGGEPGRFQIALLIHAWKHCVKCSLGIKNIYGNNWHINIDIPNVNLLSKTF